MFDFIFGKPKRPPRGQDALDTRVGRGNPPVTKRQVLEHARQRIQDGPTRLPCPAVDLRMTWWPEKLDLVDQIKADYGIRDDYPEIAKLVDEELAAIQNALKHFGYLDTADPYSRDSAGVQRTDVHDVGVQFEASINLVALSYSLWDEWAMPIRRYGELIVRISPRRNILGGSHQILGLAVNQYLGAVIRHTAESTTCD